MRSIITQNLSRVYKSPVEKTGLARSAKGLFRKEFKYINAVTDMSFCAEHGDKIGILGLNGAGKSTLIKMLCGIIAPTSGSVVVGGYTPFQKKNDFLRLVSLVAGNKSQLNPDLSAWDNFRFLKSIYRVPERQFSETARKLTLLLECANLIDKQIRRLSFGERIKMEIVAALIHRPKFLFLDEPTIGLDVRSQESIRKILSDYCAEGDAVLFVTSHNLSDIVDLCNRILVIDGGTLRYDGGLAAFCAHYNTTSEINIEVENCTPRIREIVAGTGIVDCDFTGNMIRIQVEKTFITTVFRELIQKLSNDINKIQIIEPRTEDLLKELLIKGKVK
ncbi:MAG: ATP-binding cassette domain-containing protein [Oscillospiraceae bacterium]|jgi:ABC-2 type transport system ATP-binding protein|nr:ATP-binding cassette domain-containing protein [Oscillospiraceae bacterium]